MAARKRVVPDNNGKIFARTCPGPCGKLVMTADQTGKTPCDDCAKPAPAPSPMTAPTTPPAASKG